MFIHGAPQGSGVGGQEQGLLGSVRKLKTVRPGDGVVCGTKLAKKDQVLLRRGAAPPGLKALAPPARELIQPRSMLRKVEGHLNVLTRGHAPLERA